MSPDPCESQSRPDPDALLRGAAAGDPEAFQALLQLHHRRLLGFVQRQIGPRWQGKIDAEDVLQETYVEALAGLSRFEPRGEDAFYHWLARIAQHRFYAHVRHWETGKRDARREQAAAQQSGSRYETLAERCMTSLPPSSRVLRRADAVGAMLGCMAGLPEHYRAAVQRLYLDEAPVSAVAAELNRSEDATRRLATRALEQLAECMGRASRYMSAD